MPLSTHQLFFLLAAESLDCRLPLQCRRLAGLGFCVGQLYRQPAAGVTRRSARSMGF